MYAANAIEIITDDGRGVVSAYSNTAIGLAADGHFYLITDRFGIASGSGQTITGDTAQATWYEGILTNDYGSFAISRVCDGWYGSLSQMRSQQIGQRSQVAVVTMPYRVNLVVP